MTQPITFEFTALHDACLDFVKLTWHGCTPRYTNLRTKFTSPNEEGDPITFDALLTITCISDEIEVEGKGQVTTGHYQYFGSWKADRFTLTSLLTDRFIIDGNQVTFSGKTLSLEECQVGEDYTLGFQLTQETKVYLPLLLNGDFLIKAPDGTKFDLEFGSDLEPTKTFLLFDSLLRMNCISHHIDGKCSINGHESRVFGTLCITHEQAFIQWSIDIGKDRFNHANIYCRDLLPRNELLAYIAGKGDKKDLPFTEAFQIKTPVDKISEIISSLLFKVKVDPP